MSNFDATGIDELRRKVAHVAAGLPLMGEKWPRSWSVAAEELGAIKERHTSPRKAWSIMDKYGVPKLSQPVLTQWLHDLGEILYFGDDEELRDIIILDPQWVTSEIYTALSRSLVVSERYSPRRAQMAIPGTPHELT